MFIDGRAMLRHLLLMHLPHDFRPALGRLHCVVGYLKRGDRESVGSAAERIRWEMWAARVFPAVRLARFFHP